MLTKSNILVGCTFLCSQFSLVQAHGYLTTPKAEFTAGAMPTNYITRFQATFDGKFDGSPQENADNFNAAFKKSGVASLRDFLKDKGTDCGYSNPNASPKPIPQDGKIVWQNPDSGEGFVPSHTGPCEAWIDDKLVFQDDNCAGHYTEKPAAHLPVDFSSCKGSCTLHFYWLALHEPMWQVYKNCVPMTGSGGNTQSTSSNDNNASPSPSPIASGGESYDTPSMSAAPESSPTPSSSQSGDNYGQQTGVQAFSATPLPTVYDDYSNSGAYVPTSTPTSAPTPNSPPSETTKKPCFGH